MKYLLKYNESREIVYGANPLIEEADNLASILDKSSDFKKVKSDYPNTIYLYELSISDNIKFQVHCRDINFIIVQLYIFDKKDSSRYYVDNYTHPSVFEKLLNFAKNNSNIDALKSVANISSQLHLKREEFPEEEEILNTITTELTDIGFLFKDIKFKFFKVNDDNISYNEYEKNQINRIGYVIQLEISPKYADKDYSDIEIKDSLNHMSGILDYYGDYKLSHHYIDNSLYIFIEK